MGYLAGDGTISLETDPPGAEVILERYELFERRLVARTVRSLPPTPFRKVALEMGSYRLRIRAPGHREIRVPVLIGRQEHWDGRGPGGDRPIHLPPNKALPSDVVYVPPGWFHVGGTSYQAVPRRRVWAEGFAIQRFPVTNQQYLVFLNNLVRSGRSEAATRFAPREMPGEGGGLGPLIFSLGEDELFHLPDPTARPLQRPDRPVVNVDWYGAMAYASWRAELSRQTGRGLQWRLPGEMEWAKAARGADRRTYPWGDFLDPSWCCMVDSHEGEPRAAPIDTYPIDESPYGVRGLAGNARDWCMGTFTKEGPPYAEQGIWRFEDGGPAAWEAVTLDALAAPSEEDRMRQRPIRGGSAHFVASATQVPFRFGFRPETRFYFISFRLAVAWPPSG